ncbi:hypothetical protein [Streptomyces sp. NPDC054797]
MDVGVPVFAAGTGKGGYAEGTAGIEKAPWGIPDLLFSPPPRPGRRRTSHLRVLFASRLSCDTSA